MRTALRAVLFLLGLACVAAFGPGVAPKSAVPEKKAPQPATAEPEKPARRAERSREPLVLPAAPLDVAVFAGGCFWCMESAFEEEEGVFSVISGYTGGPEKLPTYGDVASGQTGHQEAVWVVFDPQKIAYEKLLHIFWQNIDPTQRNGQFADLGTQYLSVIFARGEAQTEAAKASKEALIASKKFSPLKIVTVIKPFEKFWPAEDYHRLHPGVYKRYFEASGRGPFIRKKWPHKKKGAKK